VGEPETNHLGVFEGRGKERTLKRGVSPVRGEKACKMAEGPQKWDVAEEGTAGVLSKTRNYKEER